MTTLIFFGWIIGGIATYLFLKKKMLILRWEYALEFFDILMYSFLIILWPVYWAYRIKVWARQYYFPEVSGIQKYK